VILRLHDKGTPEAKTQLKHWTAQLSSSDVGLAYLCIMMEYDGKLDFDGFVARDKNIRRAFNWLERRRYVKKRLSGVYAITKRGRRYYDKQIKHRSHFVRSVKEILAEDRKKQEKTGDDSSG
jgi:hypothetical protein